MSAQPPLTFRLQVENPPAGQAQSSIPWIEVRGRAGTAELFEADLVIAIDTSLSTMRASGIDLDEDGVIGKLRGMVRTAGPYGQHPRSWTTDSDDTILRVEVEAARALILGLEQRRNRIGLLTYTEKPRVRARIGAPADALASLDRVRIADTKSGTSVSAVLQKARDLFSSVEGASTPRQRAILLLSDGRPTAPTNPYLASLRAVYEAEKLSEQGIDLYVFSFGPVGHDEGEFLLELAGAAEGRIYRVGNPRRLLEDLPPLDLAPRWLEIENATSGAKGQAVRTFSDGRFDAFVALAPGENRIRVMAELGDGRLQRWEHDVRYEPPETESEEQRLEREDVERELSEREADGDPATHSEP